MKRTYIKGQFIIAGDAADVAAFAPDFEVLPVGIFRPCLAAGIGHYAEDITVAPAVSAKAIAAPGPARLSCRTWGKS